MNSSQCGSLASSATSIRRAYHVPMDYHTAQVKHGEIKAKLAVDLAKVEAEKSAQIVEVEARGREAILKAESELIKTRAEHVDSELMPKRRLGLFDLGESFQLGQSGVELDPGGVSMLTVGGCGLLRLSGPLVLAAPLGIELATAFLRDIPEGRGVPLQDVPCTLADGQDRVLVTHECVTFEDGKGGRARSCETSQGRGIGCPPHLLVGELLVHDREHPIMDLKGAKRGAGDGEDGEGPRAMPEVHPEGAIVELQKSDSKLGEVVRAGHHGSS